MQYTVTATIVSGNIDNGEPVDVQWYSGDSLAQAMAAMVQAAAHERDDSDIPERMRYRTLSVRLDIKQGGE